MNRHLIILRKSVWVVLLAGVLACGEEPPPAPQPKAVSKKIAVQQAKPTPGATLPSPTATPTPVTGEATPAPATPAVSPTPAASSDAAPMQAQPLTPASPALEAEKGAPGAAPSEPLNAAQATTAPGTPSASPPPVGDGSTLVKESMQLAASYDAEGRFDPFEPLFKEQQSPSMSNSRDKRKRVPQTPLEKVALAQLKVTAIIRAGSGNRALVEDATGKGYVVQVGTYMGLNSGQVTRIENDRVVVEEEIESLTGELTIENQELKLQKPAGEL
jgi:type IV pilus assembly protein PilP